MQNMGDGSCPFEFNFDPATFKIGDMVSYRVTGDLADWPFVGTLTEVHDDYVMLQSEQGNPDSIVRGTRESRPVVQAEDVL